MKIQILVPLAWIFAFISCNGQVQTNQPKEPVKDQGLGLPIAPEDMQASLDTGIDPYFVESNDTFSTRGCVATILLPKAIGINPGQTG